MQNLLLIFSFFVVLGSCNRPLQSGSEPPSQIDSLLVDSVWAGHKVGFSLLTKPPYQYVAYYDSDRNMVVAQRKLDEKEWMRMRLPEKVEWDSHNYIALAVDKQDFIHVSGNMHGDSLVYFKSQRPADVKSLQRVKRLIGNQEEEVTYPLFFESPEGELIFQYRIGSSGKGNQIFNRYDPDTQSWSRLLDQPLVDGKGEMNAYLHGPVLGPDGFYHLVWVWRDTPNAATNHDLSYAKSKNLVDWYKSNGAPQSIPITYANAEVIDPVPAGAGMLNGNTVIGFDSESRPVVSYHKFDKEGNTQLYNARLENEGWKIYQTTDWNFRWNFGGYGSLDHRVALYSVTSGGNQLTQKYYIDTAGVQKILLDPNSLKEQSKLPDDRHPFYQTIEQLRSDFAGMEVHTLQNIGHEQGTYVLRWETLPPHNDQPLEGEVPAPQPLMLYYLPSY